MRHCFQNTIYVYLNLYISTISLSVSLSLSIYLPTYLSSNYMYVLSRCPFIIRSLRDLDFQDYLESSKMFLTAIFCPFFLFPCPSSLAVLSSLFSPLLPFIAEKHTKQQKIWGLFWRNIDSNRGHSLCGKCVLCRETLQQHTLVSSSFLSMAKGFPSFLHWWIWNCVTLTKTLFI